MRICIKCKQLKNFNEFHKSKERKSGYQGYCKICRKKINANRWKKFYSNPKRRQDHLRERRKVNRIILVKESLLKKGYCPKCKKNKDVKEFRRYTSCCNKCRNKYERNRLKKGIGYYFTEEYKRKEKARRKTKQLIKKGEITKQNYCSLCDSKKNIEVHHTNYSKPSKITWLCKECHCDLHKKQRHPRTSLSIILKL